jgi:hypothetical protein
VLVPTGQYSKFYSSCLAIINVKNTFLLFTNLYGRSRHFQTLAETEVLPLEMNHMLGRLPLLYCFGAYGPKLKILLLV